MERKITKMNNIRLVVIILASIVFLTGCWDRMELDERAYVVALGIDKNENGHFYDITFQVANPQVGSSATGDEALEPPSDVVTIAAQDIVSAKDIVNTVITRRISFHHLQTLIIGEELARSERGHHIVGSAIVEPEFRHSISFIVSKERAEHFIRRNKPVMETRPHKYYEFMRKRWKDLGNVPDANLNHYFKRMSGELFLAVYATAEKTNDEPLEDGYISGEVPQKGGDLVQMVGSAVFKYGKMIGTLTGIDTRIVLGLRDEWMVRGGIDTFQDPLAPDYPLTVRIYQISNPKIDLQLKQDPIGINVNVPVRLHINSDLSLTKYVTDVEKQQKLKRSLKKQLEERTRQTLDKVQNEFKGDPFTWYLRARKKFLTTEEFKNFNWEKKFTEADITVTFDVEIASFGEQAKPAKLRKS